jgi:hypothetical protein
MHPLNYFHELVEPTIVEFEKEPANKRHAYAACLFAYHFADAAAIHETPESDRSNPGKLANKIGEVRKRLADVAPEFRMVEGIATMVKHIMVTKVLEKPRIEDTHVGKSAPFNDGRYWSDETSWTENKDVVRTRNDRGHLVDVLWCVREARHAIETYLAGVP